MFRKPPPSAQPADVKLPPVLLTSSTAPGRTAASKDAQASDSAWVRFRNVHGLGEDAVRALFPASGLREVDVVEHSDVGFLGFDSAKLAAKFVKVNAFMVDEEKTLPNLAVVSTLGHPWSLHVRMANPAVLLVAANIHRHFNKNRIKISDTPTVSPG